MADGPPAPDCEDSGGSELSRFLLAVIFGALTVAAVCHIASYFGFVLIQSQALRQLLTWPLVGVALWKVFSDRRTPEIPRVWSAAVGLTWLYAVILLQFSPANGHSIWPRMAGWLGLDGADLPLAHARTSSALQLAAALALFDSLLHPPAVSTGRPDEETGPAPWPHHVRSLALFGIALPFGVTATSVFLQEREVGPPGLIEWTTIIAGFWLITGLILTGVSIIRHAAGRDT